MKKKLISLLCCTMMLCTAAVPVLADENTSDAGEKTVISEDTNPNTGTVTLGTVSVALAGCVVLVFKKRK
ncbi:MAG: NPXTG-anchored protein [Ruminococcus sp.]|uniref:NPXTG-anchored protein n=1 Tax=Ruminococcus sp. TaxID=41978 RepID=UPI0025FD10E7|nr:NPXTG-anchored protein [Ruminococcus sp.]MBO4867574.1 NPXTG-anchored protein [Ruminococcus sp.]